MPVFDKNLIFISEEVKEEKNNLYGLLKDYCTQKLCYCEILEEDDVSLTEDKEQLQNIRYGCITDRTELVVTKNLLESAVPIILLASGNRENYMNKLKKILKIDDMLLNKMIFDLEVDELPNSRVPWEVLGAIRWVHNYYYFLEEKKESLLNEKEMLLKECQENNSSLKKQLFERGNSVMTNIQNNYFLRTKDELRKMILDQGRETAEKLAYGV